MSAALAQSLEASLSPKGISLAFPQGNLVDNVWGAARPPPPTGPLRVLPLRVAGVSAEAKLAACRASLAASGADALAVAALDEVAWLLNLRGGDVACNPVFLAFMVIEAAGPATLFIDARKLPPEVSTALAAAGVTVEHVSGDGDMCEPWLARLSALSGAGQRVMMDEKRLNAAAARAVPPHLRVACPSGNSPLTDAKALKNTAEIAGMRAAHVRDGAALVEFMAWLFATVAGSEGGAEGLGRAVSEVEVDAVLTAFRRARSSCEGRRFVDVSFPTIAGADGNGAVVHHRAQAGACGLVGPSTMLLLDSGAQYEDGTTDVTRTVHLGEPTPLQREAATRVLQGHIALDRAVFPAGTPGCALDALCRTALWRAGLDYGHGTGHGVGAALNVHEGPQSISPRFDNLTPLQAGMVVSNEPGYYRVGCFGVRLENLLHIVHATPHTHAALSPQEEASAEETRSFLRFERLTLVPFQKKLIDASLLSADEAAWVDAYHAEVRAALAPELKGCEHALKWLLDATEPL